MMIVSQLPPLGRQFSTHNDVDTIYTVIDFAKDQDADQVSMGSARLSLGALLPNLTSFKASGPQSYGYGRLGPRKRLSSWHEGIRERPTATSQDGRRDYELR